MDADEQHGAFRVAQDLVGGAAVDRSSEAAAAVGGHHDQVGAERFSAFDDLVGGITFGRVGLDGQTFCRVVTPGTGDESLFGDLVYTTGGGRWWRLLP